MKKIAAAILSVMAFLAVIPSTLSAYTPMPGAYDRPFKGNFRGFPEVLHITHVHVDASVSGYGIDQNTDTSHLIDQNYIKHLVEAKINALKNVYPPIDFGFASGTIPPFGLYLESAPAIEVHVGVSARQNYWYYYVEIIVELGTVWKDRQRVSGGMWERDHKAGPMFITKEELQVEVYWHVNDMLNRFINEYLLAPPQS